MYKNANRNTLVLGPANSDCEEYVAQRQKTKREVDRLRFDAKRFDEGARNTSPENADN
jgi:hypothetical protein